MVAVLTACGHRASTDSNTEADSLSVDSIEALKVDSIGENAAIVSWRGYQDSYRLLVADRVLSEEEKPTYAYLIDSIVTSSDRVLLENLNATTNYFVYAQGICGDGDSYLSRILNAGFDGVYLDIVDAFEEFEG